MLRFVLTRRDSRVSFPMSQSGLEMPHCRRLLFGLAVTVEQRKVAGRENLFRVVRAEVRHRVCISEGEAKFLVLSCGRSQFLHQPVRRDGILLQLRRYFERRDSAHFRSAERSGPPLPNVKNAASGHGLTFDEISHGEESRAVPGLDVAFRKPLEVEIAPEETGHLRHGLRSRGYRTEDFVRGCFRKARTQHLFEKRVRQAGLVTEATP